MDKPIGKGLILVPLCLAIVAAWWLNAKAQQETAYLGLPAVPCVDPAKPVLQQYDITLSIEISGRALPLAPDIGHDYAHCLRVLHTDDASGTVHIQANDHDAYTLGEFFNVWHSSISAHNVLDHEVGNGHTLTVFVDGTAVDSYGSTPLTPGAWISIVYR